MDDLDCVPAFHGTSRQAAEAILVGGFRPSRNAEDWLGTGFYLWERGIGRASEWAREWHEDPVVLRAVVSLVGGLDLTDVVGINLLQGAWRSAEDAVGVDRLSRIKQPGKARRRDALLMNASLAFIEDRTQQRIRTVREAFAEGEPLGSPTFADTGILDRSHVQICVRDTSAIVDLRIVDLVPSTVSP